MEVNCSLAVKTSQLKRGGGKSPRNIQGQLNENGNFDQRQETLQNAKRKGMIIIKIVH